MQPLNAFSLNPEMSITPFTPSDALDITVGNVHTTNEADLPINDNHFSVVTIVHLAGENGENHLQERINLDTRLLHSLEETPFHIPTTNIIIHDPNLNTFPSFLDQSVTNRPTNLVIVENIIFNMDVMLSLSNRFQKIMELIGPISIDLNS